MPIRLIVPGVSAAEVAGDVVADPVGISKRTLAKRNNRGIIFFMKRTFSALGCEYNSSEHNILRGLGNSQGNIRFSQDSVRRTICCDGSLMARNQFRRVELHVTVTCNVKWKGGDTSLNGYGPFGD